MLFQNRKDSKQKSWKINIREYKTASTIVIAVVFVVGAAVILFNDDSNKRSAQQLTVPESLAVDMPGWWYKDYFGSSVCDKDSCLGESDPDSDKLTNSQEFYYRSNPVVADTNNNGKIDGEDVAAGIDPSKEGNMTFDQAASDDNIFGESLAFSDDVKNELTKSLNPNNVVIPQASDSELKITQEDSAEAVVEYLTRIDQIISKYFTVNQVEYITSAMTSNNLERLEDVRIRSESVALELKSLAVPSSFLTMHKYTIAYFDLLKIIIYQPTTDILTNEFSAVSNKWYDSAQAFMVLNERMDLEYSRLTRSMGVQP